MIDIGKVRVRAGFGFALVLLYLAEPTRVSFLTGVAVAAAGLGIRIWASGYLKKGSRLTVEGPYAWTRNPLYLGSLLMGLGFSITSARWTCLLIFLILFPAVYIPVIKREEEELSRSFGETYSLYRKRVPLLVPALARGSRLESEPSNFQWRQVIMNGEQNAMAGFLLLAALLWLKMVWP